MSDAPALHIRGLTRRFRRITAVESLDLDVLPGDVYGFLGPNGAGKTTAIRCILGLIRRDRGSIQIFGESSPTRARRHVGAIVETPAFHRWLSGVDNLRIAAAYADLPRRAVRREIERALERVGLRDRARDRVGGYSLGMRQRLAIARALLGNPRLLLLDEPTNGLDPRGMSEVRDLLRSLAAHDGMTVFVSSHLLGEVQQVCNRVGIIHHGTMRAEGVVADLLRGHATGQHVEIGARDLDRLQLALEATEGATVLRRSEGRVRLTLEGVPIAALNRRLVEEGHEIDALVPAQVSLEDVFLELTR